MNYPLDVALVDILIHAAILNKSRVPEVEVVLVGGTSLHNIEDAIKWFPFFKIIETQYARVVRPQWEHSYFDIPETENIIDISVRKIRELEIDPILVKRVHHILKYYFQYDYRGRILRTLELERARHFSIRYQVK